MQLIARMIATQATVDRFLDQPFQWGTTDCARLASAHLFHMGYPDFMAGTLKYQTLGGARRAMKKAGVKTLPAFLDKHFERIAPAAALEGDVLGFPGSTTDPDWIALGVHAGHGRIIGFANGSCSWARALEHVTHAWRVPPVGEDA